MEWIRAKNLPNIYPISERHAYELLRQFRAESDGGWIKDGKVLIVKQSVFEEWWKEHGTRKTG